MSWTERPFVFHGVERVDLKAHNVSLALEQFTLAPITWIRQIDKITGLQIKPNPPFENAWIDKLFKEQTPRMGTTDTETKPPPLPPPTILLEPRAIKGVSLSKTGVGQNIALPAVLSDGTSIKLVLTFSIHSTSYYPKLLWSSIMKRGINSECQLCLW